MPEISQMCDRGNVMVEISQSSPKAVTGNSDNEAQSLFEEQFQHVMRNASMVELSKLITEESRMTEEMRSFGPKHLPNRSPMPPTLTNISYEISMLNEKLRHQLFPSN
ncbi:hypothetical protein niasHS_005497 [Heterodera schachtii]|uniref:Uncharacterized protein n=1 Tax=Heterodera schachtii TaxID=97005 RepID=A0ABD2K0B8_HETSC